ncbi:MAG: hypothetical protein OHK0015_12620 [Chloroflexi bacterium OHK40]
MRQLRPRDRTWAQAEKEDQTADADEQQHAQRDQQLTLAMAVWAYVPHYVSIGFCSIDSHLIVYTTSYHYNPVASDARIPPYCRVGGIFR